MTTGSGESAPGTQGREVLLVSHSGREEIAATAQRVAKLFGDAGSSCASSRTKRSAPEQWKFPAA